MKITTAIILLLVYTFALSKPVLPLLKDAVAHTFHKAEHIATVHHHHGHHHAEKEVAKVAHEKDENRSSTPTQTVDPVSVHIVVETSFNIPALNISIPKFGNADISVSKLFLDIQSPPPKFS